MPRDLVPQKIVDAILHAGGTAIYGMDIAAHPTGPGYCVYDRKGNVACFDYDPDADRASIRYSTIPGVGTPARPDPVPASQPQPEKIPIDDILPVPAPDLSWPHLPSSRTGFIPNFFDWLAALTLFAGLIIGVASESLLLLFLFFLGSCVLSVFFAWMAAVLRSLRRIEFNIYTATHPEWVEAYHNKKAGK